MLIDHFREVAIASFLGNVKKLGKVKGILIGSNLLFFLSKGNVFFF